MTSTRGARSEKAPAVVRAHELRGVEQRPEQRQQRHRRRPVPCARKSKNASDEPPSEKQREDQAVGSKGRFAGDAQRRWWKPRRRSRYVSVRRDGAVMSPSGVGTSPFADVFSSMGAGSRSRHGDEREDSRHRRDPKHRAQWHAELQQQRGRERPDDGARVVHRVVEAERAPRLRVRHRRGDQRVAW